MVKDCDVCLVSVGVDLGSFESAAQTAGRWLWSRRRGVAYIATRLGACHHAVSDDVRNEDQYQQAWPSMHASNVTSGDSTRLRREKMSNMSMITLEQQMSSKSSRVHGFIMEIIFGTSQIHDDINVIFRNSSWYMGFRGDLVKRGLSDDSRRSSSERIPRSSLDQRTGPNFGHHCIRLWGSIVRNTYRKRE
jgi:hypothetical protein